MIPDIRCFEFCEKIGIGKLSVPKSPNDPLDRDYEFSFDDIHKLMSLNSIFDGSRGGLVLGNLHSQCGIHIIKIISKDKYIYFAEMEGWEYLTSPLKNHEYTKKFEEINNQSENIEKHISTEFDIPKNCKIIDTSNVKIPFLLLSYFPQFIIKRSATKKHIKQIIELDKIMENHDIQNN